MKKLNMLLGVLLISLLMAACAEKQIINNQPNPQNAPTSSAEGTSNQNNISGNQQNSSQYGDIANTDALDSSDEQLDMVE